MKSFLKMYLLFVICSMSYECVNPNEPKRSVKEIPRFRLRNFATNKCLDDTGIADIGQGYQLMDCDKSNKNQWFKVKDSKNYDSALYHINLVGKTGLCISAKYHNLVQEKCGDSDDLVWDSQKQANGRVFINKTGRVIDIMDNSSHKNENGNTIIIGETRNNSHSQIWFIELVQTQEERKLENAKLEESQKVKRKERKEKKEETITEKDLLVNQTMEMF